jgi:signal transduction histidine kinase
LSGLVVAYPLWSWRRLVSASNYLQHEIARFEQPPYAPERRRPDDTLGRQVGALSRAADHMRDLARLFEDAIQSLPDAAVLIDHEDVITLANSRAAGLAGLGGPTSLIGLKIGDWLAAAIGALEADAVIGALAHTTGSTEITSARGVDYEVSKAHLADATGDDAGAILRLADITAVRSAMRQREQALQFLTHDIRSPLSSVLAILQTESDRPDQASAKIDAYARRALALAEGYVQFARAESYRFEAETFDISQVALDAADEIWPRAASKSIRLDTDGIEPDLLVNGDRSLVARALINTLDNAVKYSPQETVVTLSLRIVPEAVVCTVTDQGPGMSQAEVATLFENFQRGAAGRASNTGAGLGLAFVHTVMKRHGGAVACMTNDAGGCRFDLSFPSASASKLKV